MDVANNGIAIKNPGYYPLSEYIDNQNEINSYCISLYLYLLDNIDTQNKTVMDIGSNMGNGLIAYNKYTNFKNFYGIDNNEKSINFSQLQYPSINFSLMDLNNITYDNNFFDVIVSIDTLSWTVNNFELFYKNIQRMLKNDGVFIFADMQLNDTREQLNKAFNIIEEYDITENIVQSCKTILDNIDIFSLTDQEKKYVDYAFNNNYLEYTKFNKKFIKYVCYKGNK